MTLPNPFLNKSFPTTKPPSASSSSGFKQDLNPGPGLPQSQISNYKYVPRPQLHHKMRNSNNYSAQYLPFSCDRCDRGFKSQEQLDAHIAEHVPCGIDGCKFVAHPKIVEKHIMMQHETGLAEQIMRLNTPEEIQKWREQRKKNFPSAHNIARRQAEQKEKMERGEVLYEAKNRFNKKKDMGKGKQKGKQPQRNNKNNKTQTPNSQAPKEAVVTIANTVTKDTTHVKIGTESKAKEELSDGEIESDTAEQESKPQVIATNALSSLLGCYASDSDEAAGTSEPPAKIAKVEQQDGSKSEEIAHKSPAKKHQKKQKKKSPKVTAPPAKQYGPKQLTLLQKLLQGEIRHERNVILQCVHYIVQQEFFGIGINANNSSNVLDEIISVEKPAEDSKS